MTELALVPQAFLTSCLAAVMGMGGGVLLIALMPGLLPAAAILPVHGVTQLASNLSRAVFGWREIDWSLIPAFTAGAVAGAWLGGEIYASLDLRWLPALIGALILLFTWAPLPQLRGGGNAALALLGFYQTGLGMLAGATGPLGAAVLLRHSTARDWLVVNTAVYMSLNHALRVAAFALLGFSFAPWWPLLCALVAAVIAGSWVGTRLRRLVPQVDFERWFRVLVTLLALRMIALPFWSVG
ncbi:MAG: sulfite exporter TauE/SafE family protein [Halioglobus sp.]